MLSTMAQLRFGVKWFLARRMSTTCATVIFSSTRMLLLLPSSVYTRTNSCKTQQRVVTRGDQVPVGDTNNLSRLPFSAMHFAFDWAMLVQKSFQQTDMGDLRRQLENGFQKQGNKAFSNTATRGIPCSGKETNGSRPYKSAQTRVQCMTQIISASPLHPIPFEDNAA